ncbi:MAG: hypothetical protein WCD86_15770, partial [Ktedonobacteraceae bacterium]
QFMFDGQWEGLFETPEGIFVMRVPHETLCQRFRQELERLGIPPGEATTQRLRDRQHLVWLQVQGIDYWQNLGDPGVKIIPRPEKMRESESG